MSWTKQYIYLIWEKFHLHKKTERDLTIMRPRTEKKPVSRFDTMIIGDVGLNCNEFNRTSEKNEKFPRVSFNHYAMAITYELIEYTQS